MGGGGVSPMIYFIDASSFKWQKLIVYLLFKLVLELCDWMRDRQRHKQSLLTIFEQFQLQWQEIVSSWNYEKQQQIFVCFFFFWAQKMLTKLTVGLKQMIGALVLCKCIPWIMCHWHTLFSFGMMKSTCSWYTLNKINRFGSKYIAFIRNNIYVKENINLIAIQLPDWSIGSIWKAMHILLSGWSAPWLCI